MINVDKQIAYWHDSANEDFAVSKALLKDGKTRHGLFFYPNLLDKPPSKKEARDLLKRASGLFRWLKKAL